MTSEQTIKTPEVRFDRRVSFFVRFLREAVQHMAALAGGSLHSWGVLSFINSFYGNAETEFRRIVLLGNHRRQSQQRRVGAVSPTINSNGQRIFVADAHRVARNSLLPFPYNTVTDESPPAGAAKHRVPGYNDN